MGGTSGHWRRCWPVGSVMFHLGLNGIHMSRDRWVATLLIQPPLNNCNPHAVGVSKQRLLPRCRRRHAGQLIRWHSGRRARRRALEWRPAGTIGGSRLHLEVGIGRSGMQSIGGLANQENQGRRHGMIALSRRDMGCSSKDSCCSFDASLLCCPREESF